MSRHRVLALKKGERSRSYVRRHPAVLGGENGSALRPLPACEIEPVVIGALSRLPVQTDRLSAALDLAESPPTEIKRAFQAVERLLSGDAGGVSEIAEAEGVTASYVSRVMRLAFHAPEITEAILDGRHPTHLTANRLVNERSFPVDWEEQRAHLGVSAP